METLYILQASTPQTAVVVDDPLARAREVHAVPPCWRGSDRRRAAKQSTAEGNTVNSPLRWSSAQNLVRSRRTTSPSNSPTS